MTIIGVAALLVCACDYKDFNGQPCRSGEDCPGWDPYNKCCGCGIMCFEGTCQEGCADSDCCYRGDCNQHCRSACGDHSHCDYNEYCAATGCEYCLRSQRISCSSSYSEDHCTEVGGLWTCSGVTCLCSCPAAAAGCGCIQPEECGSFCTAAPIAGSCYGVMVGRCYEYEILEPGCYCVPGENAEFVLECYD